jgi:hypothetical protein
MPNARSSFFFREESIRKSLSIHTEPDMSPSILSGLESPAM